MPISVKISRTQSYDTDKLRSCSASTIAHFRVLVCSRTPKPDELGVILILASFKI